MYVCICACVYISMYVWMYALISFLLQTDVSSSFYYLTYLCCMRILWNIYCIFLFHKLAEKTAKVQTKQIQENWKPLFLPNYEFMHLMLEVGLFYIDTHIHLYIVGITVAMVCAITKRLVSQKVTRKKCYIISHTVSRFYICNKRYNHSRECA